MRPYLVRYYGRRAPHGARGLKFAASGEADFLDKSRPARGAWIEMFPTGLFGITGRVAPRTGRVD